MAYQNNPSGLNRDSVRLLVGDISTSTAAEYLSNGDYDFFLTVTPNIYSAAAMAARALAALFATEGTKKQVGDLVLERPSPIMFQRLAESLDRSGALQASPYAGGISRSDKRAVEQDTDRVRPAFRRAMFDNPNAVAPDQMTGLASAEDVSS